MRDARCYRASSWSPDFEMSISLFTLLRLLKILLFPVKHEFPQRYGFYVSAAVSLSRFVDLSPRALRSFILPPRMASTVSSFLAISATADGLCYIRYVTRGSRSRGHRPGANRDTSRRVSAAFVRKTASGPQENIPKAKMEQQERLPDPRFVFNDRDCSTAEGESIELSCTPSSSSPRVAIPIIMKPRLSKQNSFSRVLFEQLSSGKCVIGTSAWKILCFRPRIFLRKSFNEIYHILERLLMRNNFSYNNI